MFYYANETEKLATTIIKKEQGSKRLKINPLVFYY